MEQENLITVVDVIDESAVRLTIRQVTTMPETTEWNADFYRIASNPTIFNYMRTSRDNKLAGNGNEETQTLTWNSLSLGLGTGWGEYKGKRHLFRPTKDHYKVLKTLLEANGEPVNYNQFFKAVNSILAEDYKKGSEYIRQKVRDIRKYFGINRRKQRDSDIFFDTGEGFQLKEITISDQKITN